jgi:hypothetical protein
MPVLKRKLIRLTAFVGIAKRLYRESQKPENQARLHAAAEKVKQRRAARR